MLKQFSKFTDNKRNYIKYNRNKFHLNEEIYKDINYFKVFFQFINNFIFFFFYYNFIYKNKK